MEFPIVKRINECFIKPKLEQYSNEPYFLTLWDLRLLSIHSNQKGLLFTKPSPKDNESFSFDNLLESLKDSLALTLVHFYPLAGQLTTRIDEDQQKCVVFVDCNKGPGAQFLHATLDMTVSDILSPTYIPKVVHSLFDNDKCTEVNLDGRSRPLLSIQVTELVDGVFIGCSMNHAIVDGTSFWHFWKVWSEIHNANSRPISISRPPLLIGKDSPILLSLNNNELEEFVVRYEPPPELMERMFHFTSQSMKRLKAKANKDSVNNGSGVIISSLQALVALVWRAIVRAYELVLYYKAIKHKLLIS
ncbi:uncharacterized acetyltransferase At3g50280-like [Chenopodium quinoa]|uniref:Uncharacterized protein n=1 Tax=Chenopodium quinoa TaxID=63459 RepID=A0A803LRB9_CHEQI|nr:uncharacterized acetyltransferase At3g50280-like [Chenopodium quinoa]